MSISPTKILLVEDNPGDARLIQEMLAETEGANFQIDWAPQLSTCLEKLSRGGIDLVLLDLGLPDSRGLDTFVRAYVQAPQIPFIVLTGLDDETLALSALRQGAQDYLVKGQTDGGLLLRAIRYATERKRIEEELRLANEELRREIEERRAVELAVEAERQRLYALLDGLPGLVYLKAPDFSLKFANRLFREICGDWEGKKCYEAIFKSEQPCENCTQFRVLETGEPSVKEATFAGSHRTYQVYSYPFADVDGASLVLTLGIDITQGKQTEERLQESEKRLRVLASQLMTAQEDERKRISYELHDELGQALLVLKLQTRAIEEELQPEQQQLREQCLEMLGHLDQVVDNVRRLSRDLSPTILEDLGLSAALRHLIREFGKHYQIKSSAQETNIDDLFPLATQIAIYRIIQESLTNIGKHSQADLLLIAINKSDDRVSFLIQDNGKGFDPAEKRRQSSGMGLAAMEERAHMVGGTLSIWSQEGAGTKISLDIPYATNKQ
ncbi:MAG: response regulator [Deltaproteobacteria bacterium]|nr:response regulator [Deltaproteobacteria bacterium]